MMIVIRKRTFQIPTKALYEGLENEWVAVKVFEIYFMIRY